MIQFDLVAPCHGSVRPSRSTSESLIVVEYSTDGGSSWEVVRKQCAPPDTSCPYFDLPSEYPLPTASNDMSPREKKRVMLEMPRSVT